METEGQAAKTDQEQEHDHDQDGKNGSRVRGEAFGGRTEGQDDAAGARSGIPELADSAGKPQVARSLEVLENEADRRVIAGVEGRLLRTHQRLILLTLGGKAVEDYRGPSRFATD